MGFPRPSFNVVIDYFSHSCLQMCKIDVKCKPNATFLYCLASTFCDIIGVYFQNGLVSPPGLANISLDVKFGGYSCLKSENLLSRTTCLVHTSSLCNFNDALAYKKYNLFPVDAVEV